MILLLRLTWDLRSLAIALEIRNASNPRRVRRVVVVRRPRDQSRTSAVSYSSRGVFRVGYHSVREECRQEANRQLLETGSPSLVGVWTGDMGNGMCGDIGNTFLNEISGLRQGD
jgi:hypothetical protein